MPHNHKNATTLRKGLLPKLSGSAGDSFLGDGTYGKVSLTSGVSGTLPVANGGTSLATLTAHAVYVGNGAAAPTALAVGANNTYLKGSTGADPAFATITLASADFANQGTTTTVLHGNASGNPSFGAVSLTADVSGILPSANGGTANGFTKFSGPLTAEKTFTLPNASATVLTDNAAVTVAQGGTGRATGTTAYALIAVGTTATGAQQSLAAGATTEILVGGGASALPVWTTAQGSGAPVRATSPALTTPNIGVATATSINFGQTALSYYGEGTWTPIDSSGATLTFATANGNYTRAGNIVIAAAEIVYPTTADGTDNKTGGLPFTIKNANGNGAVSISICNAATVCSHGQTILNSTTIVLKTSTSNTSLTNVNLTGAAIRWAATYLV